MDAVGQNNERKTRGEMLKLMRGDMTLEEASVRSGLDEKTIRNAEKGTREQLVSTIISLVKVYNPPITQVLSMLQLDDVANDSVSSDNTTHQRNLLSVFKDASYSCYYMSEHQGHIEKLTIEQLREGDGSYLYASAKARGHLYDCRVECAEVGTYAFLVLKSDTRLSDRAYLILPYIRKLETKFSAGVGALLSLAYPSRTDSQHPCFQLVVIINNDFLKEVGEDTVQAICEDYLKLPKSEDGFRLSIPNITDCSDALFHQLVESMY